MIFPKADETLLLDVLANADNNVQKASEKIISLGYTKKEFVPNQKSIQNPVDQSGFDEQNRATQAVTTIPLRPKQYTEDEKLASKYLRLKHRFFNSSSIYITGLCKRWKLLNEYFYEKYYSFHTSKT